MESKKLIEKLKGQSEKARVSLYLNVKLFNEFKVACGTVPPSRIVEELIRNFMEGLKKENKTPGN